MILVTRNQDKSLELSQKLRDKGFATITYPLFQVLVNKISIPDKIFFNKNPIDAVVISSNNAIKYLQEIQLSKNIAIFTIGENTANNLQELGYSNIKKAQNSAISLLELVKNCVNKQEQIIYLCGEIVTIDLSEKLQDEGFKAKKIISYKIQEQNYLCDEVITKIKNYTIEFVTIYSKNTLTIFHKLLLKHNLLEYCSSIKLLCLSDEIIKYAARIGFPKGTNINLILNNNAKN